MTLISSKQAAKILRVHHYTILRWVKEGLLKTESGYQRHFRFSISDVLGLAKPRRGRPNGSRNKRKEVRI